MNKAQIGARFLAQTLSLAASPVFAFMAFATAILDEDPAYLICSAAHSSPLTGMLAMYVLMAIVHIAPWLKLTSEQGYLASGS